MDLVNKDEEVTQPCSLMNGSHVDQKMSLSVTRIQQIYALRHVTEKVTVTSSSTTQMMVNASWSQLLLLIAQREQGPADTITSMKTFMELLVVQLLNLPTLTSH